MKDNLPLAKLVIVSKKRFKGDWTILSALIKIATRSEWHHCLFIKDGWCYEAVKDGFKKTITAKEFRSKVGIDYEIKETYIVLKQEDLEKELGTPYDYVALFYHLLQQFNGKWYGGVRTDKTTCGAICAKLLGYPQYWRIDPQDLYEVYKDKFIKDTI